MTRRPGPSDDGDLVAVAADHFSTAVDRPSASWLAPSWNVLTFWSAATRETVPPALPDGATHVWYAPSWLDDEERLVGLGAELGQPAAALRQRFAAGRQLATLRCGGPVASSGWISSSRTWIDEAATWFAPPRGHAYIWDCVTRANFRGQGLYPILLSCIARRLGESDVDWSWIGVEWANWRSLGGIIHAGFRPVGAIVALRLSRLTLRQVIYNLNAPEQLRRALGAALSER